MHQKIHLNMIHLGRNVYIFFREVCFSTFVSLNWFDILLLYLKSNYYLLIFVITWLDSVQVGLGGVVHFSISLFLHRLVRTYYYYSHIIQLFIFVYIKIQWSPPCFSLLANCLFKSKYFVPNRFYYFSLRNTDFIIITRVFVVVLFGLVLK